MYRLRCRNVVGEVEEIAAVAYHGRSH
jgi:hypothetical protein